MHKPVFNIIHVLLLDNSSAGRYKALYELKEIGKYFGTSACRFLIKIGK